ncbi:hypothetical protein C8R43DRAFT_951829 [Mycena crocata]|nr:hypothetical protein C8R43DRAFT_951829 [Mycena crocata]
MVTDIIIQWPLDYNIGIPIHRVSIALRRALRRIGRRTNHAAHRTWTMLTTMLPIRLKLYFAIRVEFQCSKWFPWFLRREFNRLVSGECIPRQWVPLSLCLTFPKLRRCCSRRQRRLPPIQIVILRRLVETENIKTLLEEYKRNRGSEFKSKKYLQRKYPKNSEAWLKYAKMCYANVLYVDFSTEDAGDVELRLKSHQTRIRTDDGARDEIDGAEASTASENNFMTQTNQLFPCNCAVGFRLDGRSERSISAFIRVPALVHGL